MKCPICKKELRRSQKNPEYGLCDNCRKRFKWVDDYDYYDDEDDFEDDEPVTYKNPKSVKPQAPARRSSKSQAPARRSTSPEASARNRSYNQEPKKKGGCLKIALIVLGVLVVIGIAGSLLGKGDDKKGSDKKDTDKKTEAQDNKKDEKTEFTVGETAEQKDVQITLVSATESVGSEFITPDGGNIFLLLEFEITNNSDSDINISSIANFEAYCDDYSLTQDIIGLQAPEAAGKNQLDGSVASGKKMNGVIAYQVPSGFANFEISVSPDFWSSSDIKFVIQK